MDDLTHEAIDSAKQRARRIPLDYYKSLTGLEGAKWLLTTLVSLAAGAYVLWTVIGWRIGAPESAVQFSPGKVAGPHAAWEADCAACHIAGTNLRDDASAIALNSALLGGRAIGDHHQIDARCQSCHSGEEHHSNQKQAEVLSCAGCHRDHQGRDASLTRVPDAVCTACHANIGQHRERTARAAVTDHRITSFAVDHPPFRSLAAVNPGLLKFNHKLHMLPGQAAKGTKPTGLKRLADVPKRYRDRLASFSADEAIQLDCSYCHEPDAAGALYQPTNFERHCAACHTGELVAEVDGAPPPTKELPHGVSAAAIREILTGMASPPTGPPRISPAEPLMRIPGRTPGENLAQTTQLGAATRVAAAAVSLMQEGRCGKCHEHQPVVGDVQLPTDVVPPALPSVWLPHARFDHAAHRAVQCVECHDGRRLLAAQEDVKPSLDGPKPMINDIDTCRQGHAPATKWGAPGVRHDCAECHRYHGGDRPPHGRGDPARGVPEDQRHDSRTWMRK